MSQPRLPLMSRTEWIALACAALVAVALAWLTLESSEARLQGVPPPSDQVMAALPAPGEGLQTVVLAGGCFWGVQAVFQHTRGVLNAVSGYAGGEAATATYSQVSGGATGHAEAVQITFDPKQVSLAQLLHIFFAIAHDPTELNRQGPDNGTQYRSVVFFGDTAQQQGVQAYIAQLNTAKAFPAPIVTEVAPLTGFYPAEPSHQNYATRHPDSPYIVQFDAPKIAALQRVFPALFRGALVLVALP
jgi:peptide-methionine (S)-S-oxide reductase